jgi:hypothetical protein
LRYNEHIKILPPAVPEAVDPAAETPEPLPATPASSAPDLPTAQSPMIPDCQYHVQAWRVSGLSRADYCRQRGLNLRTFVTAQVWATSGGFQPGDQDG